MSESKERISRDEDLTTRIINLNCATTTDDSESASTYKIIKLSKHKREKTLSTYIVHKKITPEGQERLEVIKQLNENMREQREKPTNKYFIIEKITQESIDRAEIIRQLNENMKGKSQTKDDYFII